MHLEAGMRKEGFCRVIEYGMHLMRIVIMKWNIYSVVTKSGFKHEFVMGGWPMPGMYSFGEVSIVRELSDNETKEYFDAEQSIYDLWYESVIDSVYMVDDSERSC